MQLEMGTCNMDKGRYLILFVLVEWTLTLTSINPFTADPIKALHFAILI